jgi:hypothetical protein
MGQLSRAGFMVFSGIGFFLFIFVVYRFFTTRSSSSGTKAVVSSTQAQLNALHKSTGYGGEL